MKVKDLNLNDSFKIGGIPFQLLEFKDTVAICKDLTGAIIRILIDSTVD